MPWSSHHIFRPDSRRISETWCWWWCGGVVILLSMLLSSSLVTMSNASCGNSASTWWRWTDDDDVGLATTSSVIVIRLFVILYFGQCRPSCDTRANYWEWMMFRRYYMLYHPINNSGSTVLWWVMLAVVGHNWCMKVHADHRSAWSMYGSLSIFLARITNWESLAGIDVAMQWNQTQYRIWYYLLATWMVISVSIIYHSHSSNVNLIKECLMTYTSLLYHTSKADSLLLLWLWCWPT